MLRERIMNGGAASKELGESNCDLLASEKEQAQRRDREVGEIGSTQEANSEDSYGACSTHARELASKASREMAHSTLASKSESDLL